MLGDAVRRRRGAAGVAPGGRGRQLRLPRAPAVMGGVAHDWPIVAAGAVYAAGRARSRQRRSAWATAAGSSRWDWPPTPRTLRVAVAGPTACGSTTAPGTSSAAAAGWAARAMAPGLPASANQFDSRAVGRSVGPVERSLVRAPPSS